MFTTIRLVGPSRKRVAVGDHSEKEINPGKPAELLYLFEYSSHEAGVEPAIREHLDEDTTFLDVGAFVGYYTLIGCEQVEEGTVISFEPFPAHYDRVSENVALNGYDVTVEPIALSDHTGKESISESGSPTLEGDGDLDVRTMRLDDYVDRNEINIDVLKVDVEGAEHRLFQGGEKTLREQEPTIVLEVHPTKLAEEGSSVANVLGHLGELGYQLRRLPARDNIDIDSLGNLEGDRGWVRSNPHVIAESP